MNESMQALCEIARSLDIPFSDDALPTEGFVNANGLRMHWLDWGHAEKPTVVFLHGAGLTAHTWDLICLSLREDFHCIALDQRGHGLTDGVHAFGVEEPRDDIREAVAALGLEGFALVGMSLGGNNAVAYAGHEPQALAAVAFIDVCPSVLASGYQDSEVRNAAIAAADSFEAVVAAVAEHNPPGSQAYKRYTLGYSLEHSDDRGWYLRYLRDEPPARSAEEVAPYMTARREKLWSLVPNIRCPALVVHGTDSVAQNRENLDHFCSVLPDARLVEIPGASHDVQEDQPAALAIELRAFLDGVFC